MFAQLVHFEPFPFAKQVVSFRGSGGLGQDSLGLDGTGERVIAYGAWAQVVSPASNRKRSSTSSALTGDITASRAIPDAMMDLIVIMMSVVVVVALWLFYFCRMDDASESDSDWD